MLKATNALVRELKVELGYYLLTFRIAFIVPEGATQAAEVELSAADPVCNTTN